MPAAIPLIAMAATGAAVGATATGLFLGLGASVWVAGVGLVTSLLVSQLTKPDAPSVADARANMVNVKSATEVKKLLYGNVFVGGVVVHASTIDSIVWEEGKNFMRIMIAYAPHHIYSYEDIYLDDKNLDWIDTNMTGEMWLYDDWVNVYFHQTAALTDTLSGDINGVSYSEELLPDFVDTVAAAGYSVRYLHSDLSNNGIWDANVIGLVFKVIDKTKTWEDPASLPEDGSSNSIFAVFNISTATFDDVITTSINTGGGETITQNADGEWIYKKINADPYVAGFDYIVLGPYERKVDQDDSYTGGGYLRTSFYQPVWNDTTKTWDTSGPYNYNPRLESHNSQTASIRPENFVFNSTDKCTSTVNNGTFVYTMYEGDATQTADPAAVLQLPEWTTAHTGNGIAYGSFRLFNDYDRLQGLPNIRVKALGKDDLYDPVSTNDIYSNNAALVNLDYMRSELGMNISDDEINFPGFITAANISDEWIELTSAISSTIGSTVNTHLRGRETQITVTAHGFIPYNFVKIVGAGINDYFPISVVDENTIQVKHAFEGYSGNTVTCQLHQRRYTIDGAVSTDKKPSGVLETMLAAVGYGKMTFDDGKFTLLAGAYTSPVKTIDGDWIVDDIKIRPRKSRDELFNAVKGVFVNANKEFTSTDFASVKSDYWCKFDAGYSNADVSNASVIPLESEFIYADTEYPFAIESYRPQRLAKILAQKARQSLAVELTCNLKAYVLDVGDTVNMDLDTLIDPLATPYVKEWEVEEWEFSTDGTIKLLLIETASGVFDWDKGEAINEDLTPNSNLPDILARGTVTNVTLTTSAILTTSGALAEQINVQITRDNNYKFFTRNEVEYRRLDSDEWLVGYSGNSNHCKIENVAMTTYVVRARAISSVTGPTNWVYETKVTQGAGSLITKVGMPKPVDPKCYFSVEENKIDRMRFQVETGDLELWENLALPEFFIVMYSMASNPNVINVSDNSLTIEGAEIIASGSTTVLTGANTVNKIKIWHDSSPADTGYDVAGMWWVRVWDASTSTYSKFTKIDWYDGLYIYTARDLAFVPAAGDTLEWFDIAFGDVRDDEFQLGIIQDGADYEIILWEDLQYNAGTFSFLGVTRNAEDSSSVDATGKEFSYCPAPGPGTALIAIPTNNFEYINDSFQTVFEVDIKIPEHTDWGSITCMFSSMSIENNIPILIRSPIVPLTYKGES